MVLEEFNQRGFGHGKAALGFGGWGFAGRCWLTKGQGEPGDDDKNSALVCRTRSVRGFCSFFNLLSSSGKLSQDGHSFWGGQTIRCAGEELGQKFSGGESVAVGCQPGVLGGTELRPGP